MKQCRPLYEQSDQGLHSALYVKACLSKNIRECGGSVVEHQTPKREVGGSKPTSAMLCLNSPKVLVIPRKQWLQPDITEKLLTGTLSLNTNKQTKT